MSLFDNLDDLPDLEVSFETKQVIKSGESLANHSLKCAESALVMAEKFEGYANLWRRLAVAHAKAADDALNSVSEAIRQEWDIFEEEETEDVEELEDEQTDEEGDE